MKVWDWIRSFWQPGDFEVVPQCIHTDTTMPIVGKVVPLTGTPRPIAERLKRLADMAAKKRRKPHKTRKPSKPSHTP